MEERFIQVPRTARYHVIGDPRKATVLWIVLHGYGQLARYFLNSFDGFGEDLLIVAPEGLNRFYLDPEHTRVGAAWMTREDRMHEIEDQITYLDALVLALKKDLDATIKVRALGFSQGVATLARWAVKGHTRFGQLVLWAGGIPPELDQATLGKWRDLKVDLVLGDQDQFLKSSDLKSMAQRLGAAGVRHQVHAIKGGHLLDRMALGKILEAE
jgi:predicted esterase